MKIGDVFFEKHTIVKMSSRNPEQWAEADVEEVDAIEIPKNATNGDMFQKIYDVWDYEKGEYTIEVFMENCIARFSLDWWNAPYKGGENND